MTQVLDIVLLSGFLNDMIDWVIEHGGLYILLLIGGILWGIMGDKKGRLSVLFGSIVLYSVANKIITLQ